MGYALVFWPVAMVKMLVYDGFVSYKHSFSLHNMFDGL